MKASSIFNGIGLTILALSFVWAAQRSLRLSSEKQDDSLVTIRFAHWQLEGGIRDAFDEIARDYEKLHPGVHIEQVAVPERIYNQWVTTQLVGGTVTDLVEISNGKGATDEVLARHFIPLSKLAEEPNPYNAGTSLEGVALRDTFIDGLTGEGSYRSNLLEYYGIPLSAFTVRMYYNRTLWRSVVGDVPPPTDYDEFIKLCARIRAINEKTGRTILPIAGSKSNSPVLMENLFGSVTQRLNQSLDTLHNLNPVPLDIGIEFLRKNWDLDTPAIRLGYEISREAGLNFQPGYIQLGRDDAVFYFVQSKALMITTGSWDSSSFRQLANFEIGVFDLPLPDRDNPKYGPYVLGAAAEGAATGLNFGVPLYSKNLDQTLDFLRYLGSYPVNSKFSRISGWLPSVVGVVPDEKIAPFAPRELGYIPGFSPTAIGPDTSRIISNANNLLVSPNGSVQELLDEIRDELPGTVRSDLVRTQTGSVKSISRQDVTLAAMQRMTTPSPQKIDQMLESQNQRELVHAWTAFQLERTAARSSSR